MYSIEKELKILRQFVKPEHMDNSEGWRCYSEDELSAAEERLHIKLPPPIREVYLYMADLMLPFYLRPLELVHWEKDYLGFFLDADNGIVIGIKRDDLSDGIYKWEETDPEGIAWEYEEDFETAYSEHDKASLREIAKKYQEYWDKLNANQEYGPKQITKMENEPRFNHTIDGFSLFLVIHALCEVAEMERTSTPNEPTIYSSEVFLGHTSQYFQDLDRRVRADFVPLSDHPELLAQDMPMQMVYVHKNPDALLIQRDDWINCELLTKSVPEQSFIEKVQEQTGLKFRCDF